MRRLFAWIEEKLQFPQRKSSKPFLKIGVEQLEERITPSVNVLSYHNDAQNSGLNAQEVALSPANVAPGTFGKYYSTTVDGQVYAQPLVLSGVDIQDGPNTSSGAAGTHDVVFVATENDSLYAIDTVTGQILWQRSFTDVTNPDNNTLGANTISAVNQVYTSDVNIYPVIGITSTPVIDAASGTIYVVTFTAENWGYGTHFVQRLHAINVEDGTDRTAPYLLGDTVNDNTNNTPIYVYGSGDGSVTDPYNNTGQPVVQFNALRELQRAALSLVNGDVYVAWASHGDVGPYHGWVAKFDVSNLATDGIVLAGVLNTSPNGGEAGIWQSGAGLAFEPDGSAFYFVTGNGPGGHGNPTFNSAGLPSDGDYYEAVVKVVADSSTSATSQNINGWGMKVVDFFIPYNQVALDNSDQDFGSGGPILLPPSASIPGHPNLLLVGGKQGVLYLLDRDNLGGFDPNNDNVLNSVLNSTGNEVPPVSVNGLLNVPAFFNGEIYTVGGYYGIVNAFVVNSNGTLSSVSQNSTNVGFEPGSPSISSNGSNDGIVWVENRNDNQLHAFLAGDLSDELWNSGEQVSGLDRPGALTKFAVPTVANGEVFVGTMAGLVAYGLTPPETSVPQAPVLTATVQSGTSVELSWTDTSSHPNTAHGYNIEESTDGINFSLVTTAPAGQLSVAVGGLSPSTKYYFEIFGYNGVGESPASNTVGLTTSSLLPILDFSQGFAGSASSLQYNGFAAISDDQLELTNGNIWENSSVFSQNPVDITRFATYFTFQISPASLSTDEGFTFTIQNNGSTALGGAGPGLGYGPFPLFNQPGIPNSIAIKFDLYNWSGEGTDSTGLYTGGAMPTNLNSIDLSSTGIDLHSGDTMDVAITYDGSILTVVLTDAITNASATQSYTIDIPGTIGSSAGYVGFTGATGESGATQTVSNWTFNPNAPAPAAPSALNGVPASATSIQLNWINNADNQTGFVLDRADDPGFTQNLTTITGIPADATSYTDTSAGLAPGGSYYYRIRAVNVGGSSANSSVISVAIPLAPPKPTDATVVDVGTDHIDLTWIDNAGREADYYLILRQAGQGNAFVNYAELPALNVVNQQGAPGTPYNWSDTNVQPGMYYEYHILAENVSGHNDFSGTSAVTLTLPPSNVSAVASGTQIALDWAAPAGAVSYNVYRETTPGAEGSVPYATGISGPAFTDPGVIPGVTYYYYVTAVNANTSYVPPIPSESDPSIEVFATLNGPAPAPPQNVVASTNGSGTLTLTWSPVTGAAGYNVYRGAYPGGEVADPLNSVPLMSPSFTDTGLTDGVPYYYTVYAFNASSSSSSSAEASGISIGTPGNVVAVAEPSQVTLTWTAAAGAAGYNIYRGLAPGQEDATPVNAAPLPGNSFIDNDVTNGVSYYYTVVAINAYGENATAAEVTATPLDTPTNVAAVAGTDQVNLSWDPVIGATFYNVFRNAAPSGFGSNPINLKPLVQNSFADVTVTDGNAYYYAVVAYNQNAMSDLSSSVAATPIDPPTSVALAVGDDQITLNWAPSTGATGYLLYRGTSAGGESATPIDATPITSTSYTDTGLTGGQTYYYTLAAVNSTGVSSPSLESSATVPLPIQLSSIYINAGAAPIIAASESDNIATFVTDGPSGFSANDPVVIANVGAGYNGTFTIAAVFGNSFSVDMGTVTGLGPVTNAGVAIDSIAADADSGPLINGAAANGYSASYNSQRSMVDGVVYTFNQAVNLGANAFTITVWGQGGQAPSLSYSSPDGGLTWVVTFSDNGVVGNSIANGEYQIVLNNSAVSAVSGGGVLAGSDSEQFYRLYGDTVGNGHCRVSAPDRNAFVGSFGTTSTSASFLAYLDFDNNGRISAVERNAFNGDFGLVYSGFAATM